MIEPKLKDRECLIEGDVLKVRNKDLYFTFNHYYSGDGARKYAYFDGSGVCLKDFNKFFESSKNQVFVYNKEHV